VHLAIKDEVDEDVRVLGVGAALRDAHAVHPQLAAFGRHDIGQILVLLHHLQDIAVVLQADVDLTRDQQILASIGGERLDLGLDLDQALDRFLRMLSVEFTRAIRPA
jgi:hypothetical protein